MIAQQEGAERAGAIDGAGPGVRGWSAREARTGAAQYAELKRLIKEAGLLAPQPAFYRRITLLTLGLLGVSVALLAIHPPFWLQLLTAALMAVAFTQLGFLLHDVCHRCLARGARRNLILGLIFGDLLTGISPAWWKSNHNAHHSHPNESGNDPNIEIPILAFTEAQAQRTRGIARFIVRHQTIFLFPIFCLQGFNMLVQSIVFLRRSQNASLMRREAPALLLHYLWYGGLVFAALGPVEGVVFILVHHGLTGLYAGSVFAPNHKGMPVLEPGTEVAFLHQQVLTARNVAGHPLTDYWYGGLNYQIEHHLFPSLPRNNLGRAQTIVRAFCAAHGIDYHETGMLASYREVLGHLKEMSAAAR